MQHCCHARWRPEEVTAHQDAQAVLPGSPPLAFAALGAVGCQFGGVSGYRGRGGGRLGVRRFLLEGKLVMSQLVTLVSCTSVTSSFTLFQLPTV